MKVTEFDAEEFIALPEAIEAWRKQKEECNAYYVETLFSKRIYTKEEAKKNTGDRFKYFRYFPGSVSNGLDMNEHGYCRSIRGMFYLPTFHWTKIDKILKPKGYKVRYAEITRNGRLITEHTCFGKPTVRMYLDGGIVLMQDSKNVDEHKLESILNFIEILG